MITLNIIWIPIIISIFCLYKYFKGTDISFLGYHDRYLDPIWFIPLYISWVGYFGFKYFATVN